MLDELDEEELEDELLELDEDAGSLAAEPPQAPKLKSNTKGVSVVTLKRMRAGQIGILPPAKRLKTLYYGVDQPPVCHSSQSLGRCAPYFDNRTSPFLHRAQPLYHIQGQRTCSP